MSLKHSFNIEVTDTFGGEANYSWVRCYTVTAKSFRGAIQAFALQHGGHWKIEGNFGDMARYNQRGACVCAFVSYAD